MNNRPILFLIICIFFISSLNAQTFYASYYNGYYTRVPTDVKTTYDNQLIVLANGDSGDANYLLKIDTVGGIVWQTKLPRSSFNGAIAVTQTTDSGFVSAFACYSGAARTTITKLDKDGNYVWSKSLFESNTNVCDDIIATENGGFAIVGHGCFQQNYLIKFDINGNILWQNQYLAPPSLYSYGLNMLFNDDNSIIVLGQKRNATNTTLLDLFIVSIDSNGVVNWGNEYIFPGANLLFPGGLIRALNGGLSFDGVLVPTDTAQQRSSFLIHLDNFGNLLWAKSFGYNNENYPVDLVQLSDSTYILSGLASNPWPLGAEILNIKSDKNGNFVWAKTSHKTILNGGGDDGITASTWINGTSFYTVGYGDNTFVSKLDNDGYGFCNDFQMTLSTNSLNPIINNVNFSVVPSNFTVDTISVQATTGDFVENIFCSTTSEEELSLQLNFNIYPNPVRTNHNLIIESLQLNLIQFILRDIQGREIKSFNLSPSSEKQEISLPYLQAGLYLAEIRSGDKSATVKIIVE